MAYNIGMNKELEIRLINIKNQISKIENYEMFQAGSEEFKDGYFEALENEKEWLEGMIANFAE
jgi:hypothetical protein